MKTKERLYFNADKSKLVPQDHPEAVSLAYAFGDELAKGDEAKLYRDGPAKVSARAASPKPAA
jgi:hypothetical protein